MYRILIATTAALLGIAASANAAEGNVDAGKKLFVKCAVCHGIGEKKGVVGPNLNDVVGRKAGTQAEFLAKGAGGYSKAMIAAGEGGLVWNEAEIAQYIQDPKKMIAGNKMAFAGFKAEQDRLDVVAYIKTFSKAAP